MATQQIIEISPAELLEKVSAMKAQGQRLVQICCSKLPDRLEVVYSFDQDFTYVSYRLTLADTSTLVPSISKIYGNSFHYENEIHDLYGIQVQGISIDFKGNFYRTALKTPFNCAPEAEVQVPS
ncbi:MAG: NADH-quinone oxidoreductase subunit C [Candidatus Omnitrophica bacterium]|nr:NADH-quinone oxidoreductase subunit C [Candidatus Omnitrophota bacterium]